MMQRTGGLFVTGLLLAVLSAWSGAALAEPVVGDVTFERKTKGDEDFPPAVFSHWLHRVKFKCYVCHNASVGFQLKAGSAAITMDGIAAGKYCGACHKGQPAFAVAFETCSRCHRK